MTEDRLIEIISAYGADEMAWPADERAAAKVALARSEMAKALLREEHALDALIAPPRDSSGLGSLKARILLAARGETQNAPARFGLRAFWRPACILLASAVLGVGLGAAAQVPPAAAPTVIAGEDHPQQLVLTVAGEPAAEEVE